MVKRLKDEKAALEEQVELLSEQMMPPSANSSALGSKSMPGPFNI
jgi:hypothetical protein